MRHKVQIDLLQIRMTAITFDSRFVTRLYVSIVSWLSSLCLLGIHRFKDNEKILLEFYHVQLFVP